MPNTLVTHAECSLCKRKFEPALAGRCPDCAGPLLVRYDLARLRETWLRDSVGSGPPSIWRYAPALPVRSPASIVSLGEGLTPLLAARRTGERIGAPGLLIKDEARNPTGSFEARGFSCLVSMCVEQGIGKLQIASEGNAGGALAAYAAAAGMEAHIFLPDNASQANFLECSAYGARVSLGGSRDMPLTGQAWRVEGEKTLGYELAEQLGWTLPDAILSPGGAGLAAISKAFGELEAMGWIEPGARPKTIPVTGPADSQAIGNGIRLASEDGIFVSPESACCIAAAEALVHNGTLGREDRIVICNTASGLKYSEIYSTRFPRRAAGETDKLGGLIVPR